ncbi:MAG: hypothetical protein QY332_10180 [Anaerolineales bacterium]|nr:MAG: hypothetical protein QY332_10180 [Anaerolineales bacterium]
MKSILDAAKILQEFEKDSLTKHVSEIEHTLVGSSFESFNSAYAALELNPNLLDAAISLKRVAGQINVLIHATGILLSLPHILQEGEVIETLSLGAGNTGKKFDLETNQRIAEYKFINWQGGAEVIRQNSLFKDFYQMAEHETTKKRYLYVIDTKYPMKFFNSGRALTSVMSRNIKLWSDFQKRYSNRFTIVREYYEYRKTTVQIIDIAEIVPELVNHIVEEK